MASVRQAVSVNITPTGTPQSTNRESAAPLPMRMSVNKVNFFYGAKQTLFDISLGIAANKVTALIGPSGCGKSTLLRTLNRMHETVRHARLEGEILLDGQNILSQGRHATSPARRHGFPTPKSVSEIDFRQRRVRPANQRFEKYPSPKPSKKACAAPLSGMK